MQLILKKEIKDLIPAMIAFNNAELMAQAQERLQKYKNKIYTDNDIAEAKSDRATLNNVIKSLNNARLDIKKQYEAPYLFFKNQVDEVIEAVNEVAKEIDSQVKEWELDRQEKKLDLLTSYFNAQIGDLAGFVYYEQIHQDKWLNVGTSLKTAQKEIKTKIEQIKNELCTIEALKTEDEAILKAYYFNTLNLAGALLEFERLKELRNRIAEPKAEPKEAQPPIEIEQEQSLYSLGFRVTGTASQLKALKDFLQSQNIKYEAIKEV